MRLKNILIIAIGLLFTSPMHAKQKEKIPDFSGEWESASDFCWFEFYQVYKLKQKNDTVSGYFNAGATVGKGGDRGRVKGKIRHGKLFIRECSTSGTNTPFVCPKFSPELEFLVKKGTILLKYNNEKYSPKIEGYEEKSYIFYKNYNNKKDFMPLIQKRHCI